MARMMRLLGLVLSRMGHGVLWRCNYSCSIRDIPGLCTVPCHKICERPRLKFIQLRVCHTDEIRPAGPTLETFTAFCLRPPLVATFPVHHILMLKSPPNVYVNIHIHPSILINPTPHITPRYESTIQSFSKCRPADWIHWSNRGSGEFVFARQGYSTRDMTYISCITLEVWWVGSGRIEWAGA